VEAIGVNNRVKAPLQVVGIDGLTAVDLIIVPSYYDEPLDQAPVPHLQLSYRCELRLLPSTHFPAVYRVEPVS